MARQCCSATLLQRYTSTMSAENRKAVIAGTIGNVLEWYGVYGYFATTISQLFFPGDDKTISLV